MGSEARDEYAQKWVDEFDARQQNFKALRIEIESELRTAITVVDPDEDTDTTTQLFKVHDLRSRVKTRKSFREKVQRKRYADPFYEMRDIVGARVVCLFLDDTPVVDQIIRDKFDVKYWQDKTKEAGPDKFGYRAIHYDCVIKPSYSGPHYDKIKDVWFEIQVKTILQDAWAVVEHILGYKGVQSIPQASRADFSALVGLFHLADGTFQRIRDVARQQDNEAIETVAAATEGLPVSLPASDIPINRSTLKALLHQLFPDRRSSEDSGYSTLVEELASVAITEIGPLRDLLAAANESALGSESERPPWDKFKNRTTYTDIGFVRHCLSITLPEYNPPVSEWAYDDDDDGDDDEDFKDEDIF